MIFSIFTRNNYSIIIQFENDPLIIFKLYNEINCLKIFSNPGHNFFQGSFTDRVFKRDIAKIDSFWSLNL
jgi:hypothetical protein